MHLFVVKVLTAPFPRTSPTPCIEKVSRLSQQLLVLHNDSGVPVTRSRAGKKKKRPLILYVKNGLPGRRDVGASEIDPGINNLQETFGSPVLAKHVHTCNVDKIIESVGLPR